MRAWRQGSPRSWWPQPLLGGATATLALLLLTALWWATWTAPGGPREATSAGSLLIAIVLGCAVVAAYQFPLHVRPQTKVYLSSVPYYLLAVLLPPPLAATAAGLAALVGEVSVRAQRRTSAGDIASEVGRRAPVVGLGALAAHLPGLPPLHPLALIVAGVALEAGDIVSCPLVLAPLSGDRPLRIIRAVSREVWLVEAGQYLLGLLGALAAARALWSPLLLIVPVALLYRALTQARAAQARTVDLLRREQEAHARADETAEAMRRQAMHDTLTGLPNRILLHDRLEHALQALPRAGAPVALCVMDLDRFKDVNDTLGHQAGDRLLREAAGRLSGAVRASDTVARLGGDEFAVLLPATTEEGAVHATRSLLAALAAPMQLEGHVLTLAASVGIALAPDHGAEATTLLRRADVAMYVAKRARSGYAVYDVRHDGHSPARLTREGELRQALARDELLLHYQPTVDVRTNRVVRVEGLARWQHPRDGWIPPDQFIPLAEQAGLIAPLTHWALERALRQSHAWRQAGYTLGVAVNLSMHSLHDPHFPATMARLLRLHAVRPEEITLEITESALMVDPTQARAVLAELTALGVRVAIDDFGTGYSSLSHLKQLPVDEVKIDQSFIRGMETAPKDMAIVRSVIELGHNLGVAVVAEGVEDEAAWDHLHTLDCDEAQGYYLSRPLPVTALEQWMKGSPWGVGEPRTGPEAARPALSPPIPPIHGTP